MSIPKAVIDAIEQEHASLVDRVLIVKEPNCRDDQSGLRTYPLLSSFPFARISGAFSTDNIEINSRGHYFASFPIEIIGNPDSLANLDPVSICSAIYDPSGHVSQRNITDIAPFAAQIKYSGAPAYSFNPRNTGTIRHSVWPTRVPDVTTGRWTQSTWDDFSARSRPSDYFGGDYDIDAWKDYFAGFDERSIRTLRMASSWPKDPRDIDGLFGKTIHRNPLNAIREAMAGIDDGNTSMSLARVPDGRYERSGWIALSEPIDGTLTEIEFHHDAPPVARTADGEKILDVALDVVGALQGEYKCDL